MWQVTCDRWHVTGDTWHVTRDRWHVTRDTWQVTCDMWHMTIGVLWTFSQNFSCLALMVWDSWCCEYLEEKDHWINQLVTEVIVEQPRLHRVCYLYGRHQIFWSMRMKHFFVFQGGGAWTDMRTKVQTDRGGGGTCHLSPINRSHFSTVQQVPFSPVVKGEPKKTWPPET